MTATTLGLPLSAVAFLGPFHVLLIHLPIGLLSGVAAIELAARFPIVARARGAVPLLLLLSAISATFAVGTGWIFAGERSDLDLHRYGGTATAVAVWICFAVARLDEPWIRPAYRLALAVTLALVAVTAHAGGTATHGRGFLTRRLPPSLRRLLGGAESGRPSAAPSPSPSTRAAADGGVATVWADLVAPLLERRCVECHGPRKAKGGLRLDQWERLARGGISGPAFVPGDLGRSEAYRRLTLPPDDEEVMPARGDPLPAEEVAALRAWIEAGLPRDLALVGPDLPPPLRRLAAGSTPPPPPGVAAP